MPDNFPPIGGYGFLSDCHTSALVSFDGAVEWLCLPRFDSPSVFASVLDREAGRLTLRPRGVVVPISRRYRPGTLVVETTWVTETGWLVVNDALSIASWDPAGETPIVSHDSDHSLLRTITCIDGEVDVEMECLPRFDYGRAAAEWSKGDEVPGELIARGEGGPELELRTDLATEVDGGAVRGTVHLKEGERAYCALSWGESGLSGPCRRGGGARAARADGGILAPLAAPRRIPRPSLADPPAALGARPQGTHLPPDRGDRRRRHHLAAGGAGRRTQLGLPLYLDPRLDLQPLGAPHARLRPGGARLHALHPRRLPGPSRTADHVRDRGERELTESTLDHLSGYGGAKPVRIGNGAFDQRQNDVWGALLDSVYLHEKALRGTGTAGRPRTDPPPGRKSDRVASRSPDQGIWESRGEPQHYVSSKVSMWVAADRGARLARELGREDLADEWGAKADAFKAEICERGCRDGVFRQHYDTEALDASLLLMPLYRFLPADDPRIVATVEAIADDLTEDGLVLRYKVDETDDGLVGKEGTFLICSFWLVSALSEIGERTRARQLCERLLGMAGQLDLYAEELEAESGRHLGNFPQAFTHLALVNAVSHVIADEKSDRGGAGAVFTTMGGVREGL